MSKKLLFLYLLIVSSLLPISSQQFYFKKYQVEEGLSHNSVWCVLQDSYGFMWFGTSNGLNHFDGHNFKVYKNNIKDKYSLGNNSVQTLYEDDNRNIWAGTSKGIFILDHTKETFARFDKKTKFEVSISSEIKKIIKSKSGQLWIATLGQGFFIYDPQHDTLTQNSQKTSFVWDIAEDLSGRIYISSLQEGLICFDQNGKYLESYTSFLDSENSGNSKINCIQSISDRIWFSIGTNNLGCLDTKTGDIKYYSNADTNIGAIHCISKYSEKELMIGSDNGLYLFNTITEKFLRVATPTNPRGLSDQSIYAILKDKEGGYWISTYLGGVNYLAQQTKKIDYYYPTYDGDRIMGKVVNTFCEDKNRNIWIGSQDGLRFLDKKTQTLSAFTLPAKSLKYDIRALLIDGDNLWVGTFGDGLKIINLKNKTISEYNHHREIPNTICSNDVLSLYKVKNGNIYIGTTWGMCTYNRDTDSFTTINYVGSMISVLSMLEDSYDCLWIATYNSGVFRYGLKNNYWDHYTHRQEDMTSINSNSVISLQEDSEGKMWFGTDGGGVSSYNRESNTFEDFDPLDTILPNKVIYSIEEDNSKNLWMSTNAGLLRVNPNKKEDSKLFTQENGLQSNQFNARSSLKGSNGEFYFGGINGFNAFYPDEFRENTYIPPVYITDLNLYNRGEGGQVGKLDIDTPIYLTKELTLSFNQNNFVIQFVALSYEDTQRNQYCYKLDGFDNEWIYTPNNTAAYSNLSPGKYTFRVKAANNDGHWNEVETTLQIVISPPWWRTTLAYLIYFSIAALLIYAIFRYNRRKMNEKIQYEVEEYNILREKELYQSKISFFVNLVHEIRTPLSLIKLPLDKITDRIRYDESASKYLSMINQNIDYLLNVVNQLLNFQKNENNKTELCLGNENLHTLLKNVYNQFVHYLELKSIAFNLILPDEELIVLVDKEIITKIIINLLSNAIKFTNSRIDLKLEYWEDYFEISVLDDGPGVMDKEKEKIFGVFYQTHLANNTGTGIGLAFSKLLAENHKGNLSIKDNEPRGAIFTLKIPLEKGTAYINNLTENTVIDTEQRYDLSNDNTFKSCHILLVEDNPDLLNLVSELLSEYFIVIKAHNGQEAIEKLANETIDIIVSDVMMPLMDGLEFCNRVKSNINTCHIPIILLTAKATNEAKIEGMEYGADVYIEKPFSMKYLKKQIENLLKLRLSFQKMLLSMPMQPDSTLAISNKDQEFLTKLQTEIDQHISEPDFSIDNLAEKMFMSRSNFYRKIKNISGMAPNDYLKTIRLNKAAELLMEDGVRIADVFEKVGFSSSSYFAKCFKAQFNVLPKDYSESQR